MVGGEGMEYSILATLSILGGYNSIGVITGRTGLESGVNLILVFVNMCGVLVCLHIDMIGLLLIIIYVGAVAVLILFVIMMLGEGEEREGIKGVRLGVGLLVMIGIIVLGKGDKEGEECYIAVKEVWSGREVVRQIGEVLFTESIYSVLAVGILLLVGMIGGVVLSQKER